MAFLWRGVGRQRAGSRSLQELNRTLSGAQAAWDSWPSPWPWGLAGPCQEGGAQDQLLGCCLGQGHLSPVGRGRDGQAFVTWLEAISLSSPCFKN